MKNIIHRIAGLALKLALFLGVWMLMGRWLLDISEYNLFGIDNANISFLLYGILVFVGAEIICYGVARFKGCRKRLPK